MDELTADHTDKLENGCQFSGKSNFLMFSVFLGVGLVMASSSSR